jgi:glycerol-3-phosphate dehydrogenase
MLAYDLLSFGKELPKHDMPGREEMMKMVPGLQSEGLKGGARYFDAQVTFAERLVLENLLAASAAGVSVRTWQRVTKLRVREHRVQELHWHNEITNERGACRARLVVNAAGPWLDQVLEAGVEKRAPLIGGTKGSHIVVSAFAGAPEDGFYVEATADGRPIFILPWNGLFLVGTTDIRFNGSPDEVNASDAEIDYLLRETNRVFPQAGLTRNNIHYAYAGVRPLPRTRGPESAITRKHIILQHHEYAKNLISIIGGKLTTYRHLAEQTVDRVVKILGADLRACSTKTIRLPGGQGLDKARLAVEKLGTLSGQGVERLLAIYGGRAVLLAELAAITTGLNIAMDNEKTTLAAEVVFSIRYEFALRLTDIIHRRMMIGLSAEQGRALYARVAELAANELHWDQANTAAELELLYAYSDSLRRS